MEKARSLKENVLIDILFGLLSVGQKYRGTSGKEALQIKICMVVVETYSDSCRFMYNVENIVHTKSNQSYYIDLVSKR